MMTSRAHSLGMVNTHFNNPNGLPDPGQLTTARDMATLAEAMIHRFPKYYPYFATRSFTYNGIAHPNHNHLMSRYPGMDGIKTGFIRASGFNLTASAVRNNRRLIAVVFGGTSAVSRDNYMAGLLDDGFRRAAGLPAQPELRAADEVADAGQPIPPPKPVIIGQAQPAAAGTHGTVAGVDLAEAGDAVEGGEGAPGLPLPAPPSNVLSAAAPAPAAAPAAPAGATPTVPVPAVTGIAAAGVTAGPAATNAPGPVAGSAREPPHDEIAALAAANPPEAQGDTDMAEAIAPRPVAIPRKHMVQKAALHTLQAPKGHLTAAPRWGVELGTFTSKAVSDATLQHAISTLPADMRASAKPESAKLRVHRTLAYKAELVGLNEYGAKRACAVLTHCLPMKL